MPLLMQMQADLQQQLLVLPKHLLAILLGTHSAFEGADWAAGLTDCELSCSGPLEHVVQGGRLLAVMLSILPRFR